MGAHLAMALMASCVHWLPLVEDRAPSLPFVSCTHRCSGQACTATFLLRFLYFGDFGGMLWKLDAETGQVLWAHLVSDYTGIAGDLARTSPSVAGNTLVVGDLRHPDMLGIDAKTGELRWITQVHPDPKELMPGSP